MEIKLIFYKSSSKFYEYCCLKCKAFENYTNEKSTNTVIISNAEIREKQIELADIVDIIKHWTKSEYYIDGKEVTVLEIERILNLLRYGYSIYDFYGKNIPSTTFADIGGIDEVILQVREVIELPMISPQIFEHYHLMPHKGILLYGPPGCGKTMLAKAIANEVRAHFIAVNGPEILNKFMGQSEENLRNVFKEARREEPSIIYFDEFDSISTRRDSDDHLNSAAVVNQLLTLMDGMSETKVCCIASTNRIDMIDEAIKRPGRFDYVIEIKKPSVEGCKKIFRIHTDKKPVDPEFDKDNFAEKHLVGLSGAEIAFVASEAAYNSIRRTIDIKSIFRGEKVGLSDSNMIIEMDFIRAVNMLKENKTRVDSAKFRYNL